MPVPKNSLLAEISSRGTLLLPATKWNGRARDRILEPGAGQKEKEGKASKDQAHRGYDLTFSIPCCWKKGSLKRLSAYSKKSDDSEAGPTAGPQDLVFSFLAMADLMSLLFLLEWV